MLTFLISSCEKTKVEVEDIPDPINGVSEYLLDKTVFPNYFNGKRDSVVLTFKYNPNGTIIENDLIIYPENLNNAEVPYITRGTLKLFCDLRKRVFKAESESDISFFDYDDKDKLNRIISINKTYSFSDTTTFKHYAAGENNWGGVSYQTKSPNYSLNPDGTKTVYISSLYKTYYYSDKGIKLKSWKTSPYNYGKMSEFPLVKYEYTNISGSLRTERFVHLIDEKGLITKTTHYYLGGVSEQKFYYKKR